ncbi:hypothetical protein P8452_77134 [Trifolium repens]|nr:hypothetical protein P8452_77134 [Trifolium repens]
MDIKNDFNPIFGVSIIFKTKGNSLFESPLIIFTSPLVLLEHQGYLLRWHALLIAFTGSKIFFFFSRFVCPIST